MAILEGAQGGGGGAAESSRHVVAAGPFASKLRKYRHRNINNKTEGGAHAHDFRKTKTHGFGFADLPTSPMIVSVRIHEVWKGMISAGFDNFPLPSSPGALLLCLLRRLDQVRQRLYLRSATFLRARHPAFSRAEVEDR